MNKHEDIARILQLAGVVTKPNNDNIITEDSVVQEGDPEWELTEYLKTKEQIIAHENHFNFYKELLPAFTRKEQSSADFLRGGSYPLTGDEIWGTDIFGNNVYIDFPNRQNGTYVQTPISTEEVCNLRFEEIPMSQNIASNLIEVYVKDGQLSVKNVKLGDVPSIMKKIYDALQSLNDEIDAAIFDTTSQLSNIGVNIL